VYAWLGPLLRKYAHVDDGKHFANDAAYAIERRLTDIANMRIYTKKA
jgi:hypothetical protein